MLVFSNWVRLLSANGPLTGESVRTSTITGPGFNNGSYRNTCCQASGASNVRRVFDYLLSVHSEKEISDSSQNRETNKLNRAKGRNDLSSCHIHKKFVVMFCDNSQYCDVYRRLTMFVKRKTGSPQGR